MSDEIFASRRSARLFLLLHVLLIVVAVSITIMRIAHVSDELEVPVFVLGAVAVLGLKYFPTRISAGTSEMWADSLSAWGLARRYARGAAATFFIGWLLLAVVSFFTDQ